jgi:DnaJ family protein B protein 11
MGYNHTSWLLKLFQICALLSIVSAEDFYQLLGISKSATHKEIKKAYRQKSLEFHPDKNKAEGAADKFSEINRAYEVLTDDEKRKIYDQHGEEGLKQHEQRGGGGGGFGGGSPFDDFFGFGQRQRRSQEMRTPSVDMPLELTLEQLYKGETFEVSYVRQVLCLRWEMCMKPNQECQGPGVRMRRQQIAPGFVQQFQQHDERCVAPGKMWLENCSECPKTTETEKIDLTVDVNKGSRPGEAITFEGVTDEKPGYKPGDLNFIIGEKPHKQYHRDGDHLYKTMEIPLVDALVSLIVMSDCIQ